MSNKKILENPRDLFCDLDDDMQRQLELGNLLVDIACRFINYRADYQLTQKQLAMKLGISQAMVSKLESGDYNPSVELLFNLSKKLNWELKISLADIQEPAIAQYHNNEETFSIVGPKMKNLVIAS